MNIADKINSDQLKIITETGKAPKLGYLGRTEMKDFCVWAKDFFEKEVEPNPSEGLCFLGIWLFEVNELNHFKLV